MAKPKTGWKTLWLVFLSGLAGMILGLLFDWVMLVGVGRLAHAFPRAQVTVAFAGTQAATSGTTAVPYVLLIVAVLLPVVAALGLPLWWYLAWKWQASPRFEQARPARAGIIMAVALIPAFLVLQMPVTVATFKASLALLVTAHVLPAFLFIAVPSVIACVGFACLAARSLPRPDSTPHPAVPRLHCARPLAIVLPGIVVLYAVWALSMRWFG